LENINIGDPSAYVLRFVAAAMAAGATFVDIRNDADDFILEYNGRPFSERDLSVLSGGLIPAHSPQPLRLLAVGVGAAFKANAEAVVVESWLGSNGYALSATPSAPALKALSTHFSNNPDVTVRVRLRERGRLRKVTKFVSKFSGMLPEAAVIWQRCRCAPATIKVNGRVLDETIELGPCLVYRSLVRSQGEPGFRPTRPTTGLSDEQVSPGAFSAALGILPRSEQASGLEVVIHGVSYPTPHNLGFHGARAVVVCPALTLNDDGSAPANDQTFQDLLEGLRRQFEQMAQHLFENIERLPQPQQLEAAQLLDELALKTAEPAVLGALYRKSLAVREAQLRPTDSQLMESRLRLADLLHAQGNEEGAAEIYRRIIPVWDGEAQNHLAKHRYQEGIETRLRALELLERISPPDDPALGDKYHDFAEVCREHRHAKAELFYRRAVAMRRATVAEHPMKLAESLYGLADIYTRQKMLTEAEPVAKEALELVERSHGVDCKQSVNYLKLLGKIYDGLGDYAGSTDYQRRAMMLKYKR
ncbi:MAG: tetratricopeptide repeat protein, partial [Candidatus Eremiobacteraeota bacterium]|nr:tetratricopeptide repeat protein [Candidatus Eremiobacteraeota bacterium]